MEQVPQNQRRKDKAKKNSKNMQEGTTGGPSHRARKVHCHAPRSRACLCIPHSGIFAQGRSGFAQGFSLVISRAVQVRFQQIKPQQEDQFRIEDCNLGFNLWISSSFYQFKTKFSLSFSIYFICCSCLCFVSLILVFVLFSSIFSFRC